MSYRLRPVQGNRIEKVQFTAPGRSLTLTGQVKAGAQISLAHDQVNQMTMTLVDDTIMSLWRNGNLRKGTTVTYGGWLRFELRGMDVSPDDGSIGLTLRSKPTAKLKDQTGAKDFGNQDVTAFVKRQFKAAGLTPIVQPGLGKRKFARAKPEAGQQAESTWDILTKARDELGLWLFEAGRYGICAKPRWIEANWPTGTNRWELWWKSSTSMHAALAGSPTYKYTADSDPHEQMDFKLLSDDADQVRPGDIVRISGNFRELSRARWIVQQVTIPLASNEPVAVTCVRVINPTPQTNDSRPKKKAKKKPRKKKKLTKKQLAAARKKKLAARRKKGNSAKAKRTTKRR